MDDCKPAIVMIICQKNIKKNKLKFKENTQPQFMYYMLHSVWNLLVYMPQQFLIVFIACMFPLVVILANRILWPKKQLALFIVRVIPIGVPKRKQYGFWWINWHQTGKIQTIIKLLVYVNIIQLSKMYWWIESRTLTMEIAYTLQSNTKRATFWWQTCSITPWAAIKGGGRRYLSIL